MSEPTVISIAAIAASIDQAWQPRDVVVANDTIVRLARLEGAFPWHHHDEDELFLCWEGTFRLEIAGGGVELRQGDAFVVPRGIEHRPVAERPAYALLIERPDTKQYGN
jgi:mannose-6-phosphate isomerase-like protein (cupin superfamily)